MTRQQYDYERPLGPWPPLWNGMGIDPLCNGVTWLPFDPNYEVVFERCRQASAAQPSYLFFMQSYLVEDWKVTEAIGPPIHLRFITVSLSP